ncbi:MAG TPA: DUF3180 domain-containing protein [Micrococcaceae bacterium]|jgi:hypothetical protein|nr:DUF3180 domain-containing protein [Micrococcaceae bacterium]
MKTTLRTMRPTWLLATALVAAAAGWMATQLTNRASLPTPVLPLSSMLTMGLITVVTFVLGLRVLRWRTGKAKRVLNPIMAARTVVLAQACAYAGAVLLGWHAGILVDQLPTIGLRSNLSVVWMGLAMVGGGLVMVIVGLVVERFCRIPPQDNTPPSSQKRESSGEEEYA